MGAKPGQISAKSLANLTAAGKGRVKGTPNKTTATMKAAIESVYFRLQEGHRDPHGHFLEWATNNPTEFYTKCAMKLIPIQVSGESGSALEIVIRKPE